MINSEKVWRGGREYAQLELITFSSWGILRVYRKWFTKPSPFFSGKNLLFGTKSLLPYQRLILPYQRLIFREVRDLETRKFVDKYILRISRLYPFVHNELAINGRTADWETWNSRQTAQRLTSGRTPSFSHTGLRISHLGSAYQF